MSQVVAHNLRETALEYNIAYKVGACFQTAQMAFRDNTVPEGSTYCEGVALALAAKRCAVVPEYNNAIVVDVIAHGFIKLPDGRILDPIMAKGSDSAFYVYKEYSRQEVMANIKNGKQIQITKNLSKAWVNMFTWMKENRGCLRFDFDLDLIAAFSIVSEQACGRNNSVGAIRSTMNVSKQYYKIAKDYYYRFQNQVEVPMVEMN
jgi:hypothetical protein